MQVKLTKPLPETLRLRKFTLGKVLEVELVTYDLIGDKEGQKTKGYLVFDEQGRPITLYAEEVEVVK